MILSAGCTTDISCLINSNIGWAHQYVTQTNEPWSKNLTGEPYFNVVPYANTYGLEPNFVRDKNHCEIFIMTLIVI